jgi:hypothetical protein
MPNFKRILDTFSRRPEAAAKPRHDVPEATRNRILIWCRDLYGNSRSDLGLIARGNYANQFWEEIYQGLLIRTGKLRLSETNRPAHPSDAIQYVLSCSGEEFLNFLEDIFSVECFVHVGSDSSRLVDEVNGILRVDNLPYCLTKFVTETVRETSGRHAGYDVTYTRAFPKVIMIESDVLHANAVAPALVVLQKPFFLAANREYLAALEDYRKGEIGDCLTKCGSAFESVLKVICSKKGWKYKQDDTASALIRIVVANTTLDGYFETLLIIVATLRNKLSTAHGAGTIVKDPAPHFAQYALNATASAILLLAQETGLS